MNLDPVFTFASTVRWRHWFRTIFLWAPIWLTLPLLLYLIDQALTERAFTNELAFKSLHIFLAPIYFVVIGQVVFWPMKYLAENRVREDLSQRFVHRYLGVMALCTVVYLWVELSFNARLLDVVGGGAPSQDALDSIERWGRLISGIAVSLIVVKSWLARCELRGLDWISTILGIAGIFAICIKVTWDFEGALIDFYVDAPQAFITPFIILLILFVATQTFLVLSWLALCIRFPRNKVPVFLGFLPLVAVLTLFDGADAIRPSLVQSLGEERMDAYSLALARRGVIDHVYQIPGLPMSREDLQTPEVKAYLALFPIVGAYLPHYQEVKGSRHVLQDHIFDAERVGFDELFGAYVGANRGICDAYANGYKPKSDEYVSKTGYRYPAGRKKWREGMLAEFGDANFPYALTEREFTHHPTIVRRFQSKLTCEGCGAWVPGMGPGTFQKFGYPESVAPLRSSMHEQLDDPAAYRDPKNTLGREAARAYWIPFWALVFSMAGALTHLYKVLFLSGTFATHRIGWAMRKVAESRRAFVIQVMEIRLADLFTKACLIFVVSLAIWVGFTENRITAMPEVNASREQLKSDHWLVGRMVFWAVNAQHHAYPINEWLRPGWLTFGTKEVPEEASASTGYAWSCSDYNSYVQPVKAKESDFNVLRMVWDAAAPGAVFRNIAHGWVHMIKRMVDGV